MKITLFGLYLLNMEWTEDTLILIRLGGQAYSMKGSLIVESRYRDFEVLYFHGNEVALSEEVL